MFSYRILSEQIGNHLLFKGLPSGEYVLQQKQLLPSLNV
jgi:hypothetical protein